MILSGKEIASRIGDDIIIDPYDKGKLNPNSYNLSLHDELLVYDDLPLEFIHTVLILMSFVESIIGCVNSNAWIFVLEGIPGGVIVVGVVKAKKGNPCEKR